ncbi:MULTISPECIES: hypothetical protein [Segatella]|uniref:Uncharacterized protein n=2 Tax=Segatella TaxID=2974251 RepID=D8DW77_9BACT|nr:MULTISPECIES: hypothetical protein [Segatella]EFI72314.1 hypothetical protein PBR_1788 [Segatella baroniae B14]UKK77351.1 hypothetical protein L6469_06060 [Segatella baroniae B14]GJG26489.1 hypothetical protein PRRU23_01890 [Segatella bryantii]
MTNSKKSNKDGKKEYDNGKGCEYPDNDGQRYRHFNLFEFEGFKSQAGLNAFTLSPSQWIVLCVGRG